MIILKKDEGKMTDRTLPIEENPHIIIYPRDFDITWGEDQSYWKPRDKNSNDAAELKRVCWLQVTVLTNVKRGKSYEIKFNISFKPGAIGWSGVPLFLIAKIGDEAGYKWKKIKPLQQTRTDRFDIPNDEKFSITVPAGAGEEKLFFGLYEIWSNKWKGGLLIHHATVEEVTVSKGN